MKNLIKATTAIAASLALGSTMAIAGDDARCASAPRSEWRSIDDVRTAAEALGYKDVRKIEAEDGCFEAYAFDKDGRRVEIYRDPVSLNIVRVKDKS